MINEWRHTLIPKFWVFFPCSRRNSQRTTFICVWGSSPMAFHWRFRNIACFDSGFAKSCKSFIFLQTIKSTGRPLNSMVKLENTIEIRSRCRKDPPNTCSFLTGQKATCIGTCISIEHRKILSVFRKLHHSQNWIAMSTVSR